MFILVLLITISPAFANVMNLNENLPTQIEDTSVNELHETEVQASARYIDENQDIILAPNVRWGFKKNMQLEYNSDFVTSKGAKNEPQSEHKLGVQWNYHIQDDWVPSIALHPQIIYPVGNESNALDPAVKLLLTYTLVGTLIDPIGQFHFNYRWTHNADRSKEEDKIGKQLIFGYSHKMGISDVLVADFLHETEIYSSEFQNDLELGWLHEFDDDMFLGLGVGLDTNLGRFSTNVGGQISF